MTAPIRAYMLKVDDEPSLEDIRYTPEEVEETFGVRDYLRRGEGVIVPVEIREVAE